ncbi:biosynthetic-type acetolactate synthase large subunit [Buchnera aphidicola]|uniref:Acetolactate synthase n=1 Tax=Buchnera aphidicola (Cinara cf. splendens/pseudotsugae 3390) TaxID=2518980 RepID=A0A451CWJ7_9GAMM|nr:biosynthetic-type acetolactate synthase large subunit [Buchnera aphidicola]VFP77719.1 Acetolactate synthase isozyme 3 large subunit [Buchnera aphidicola (Cinara cf. splendens/pseudotsugae 3390)]
MILLSGAEMVVKSLIDLKIDTIFGYPGGAVLDIYDALYTLGQKKIRHILVRHEQGAVHMADGYARCTGKIGVVLVTSGPGATNAITGIATAYMDSIPLIIISGQVSSDLIGFDAFQECDMIGISRPIVKHSFLVKKSEDIPLIFKRSYLLASTGRPGPIVIDLPKNILDQKTKKNYIWPKNVKIKSYHFKKNNKKKHIKQALNEILISKKPIIYVGGGIISSNSHSELYSLATLLNIPVTLSLMALGAFPGNNPQCLSMLGMHGTYQANMAMHHSDMILAIGVRFDDRTTNNVEKYCPNAKIIHIDIDPTSISKTITANIPIIGDAKKILLTMLDIIKKNPFNRPTNYLHAWWKTINSWKKIKINNHKKFNTTIKSQNFIKILYKLTKGNAYVASDVGQHQMFTALNYIFDKPRRWINSGGLGTMGFGLPAALGVKIAFPKKLVVCITGDGSIQMNIQELSTAKQYGLAILVINLNNQSLGMVKQWQDIIYEGRHSHSYMQSLPNFTKLAKSYGHVGLKIKKPTEIVEKLKIAIQKVQLGSLVFVDVYIEPDEHIYPMQIKNGGMNDMLLQK